MLLCGLEGSEYKDSTKNHLLKHNIKKLGNKKLTIQLHYTTTDKQLLNLYYPHLIPSRRKVLDSFLITQESQDSERG